MVNILIHLWEILTFVITPATITIIVSVIAIWVASKNVTEQIRISRQPLLIFKIQDTNIRENAEDIAKKFQLVENVGSNTAVNINIFRSFLDITHESFLYKHMYKNIPNFIKKKIKISPYQFADLTLEESLGTLKSDEYKSINLLPLSVSYDLFIVQYQDMLGNYYQSLLIPQNGRGDFEKIIPPKKISSKERFKSTFIGQTNRITLTNFLKNGYEE